eukprot:gene30040-35083_t
MASTFHSRVLDSWQDPRLRCPTSIGTSRPRVGRTQCVSVRALTTKEYNTPVQVYDFPQWEQHRKQGRLIDGLLSIFGSHIILNIVPSLAWVASISTLLTLYMHSYNMGLLPNGSPSFADGTACSAFINNTAVALSLLLVFRTNTSYARWDEARKMWGGMLNRSRDLMRLGVTCFPDEDVAAKRTLARWIVAFARSMRIHFQPEVTLSEELSDILTEEELHLLKKAHHRPLKAIHVMSQVLRNVDMCSRDRQNMNEDLTFYEDVLGGSERILLAPIPVLYTRHTARFLFLWLTVLPFSLFPTTGVWTTVVVVGVAMVLCGIEEIGVQCEEPFGILPLDVICNRIQ